MKFITPFDKIESMLMDMQTFIEAAYSTDNGAAITNRAEELERIMALSGKLCADAKYHKDTFTNSAIMDTLKESLNQNGWSISLINKKVESLAKDYNYIEKWADRINRTATHQLDFSRTLLSKIKAELQR
jgi:hypothetical protein